MSLDNIHEALKYKWLISEVVAVLVQHLPGMECNAVTVIDNS